jgi:hypothetical protein
MDSLEAAGTSTEAEDLTWARQRDAIAIDLNLNKLFTARENRETGKRE